MSTLWWSLSLVKVKLLGQEKKVLKVYTTSLEDKAKIIKSKLDDNNFRRNSGIYELQSTFQSFLCKHAKRILWLSKYAINALSFAELGWFPIQHKIILATMKYWSCLTTNSLLDKAFAFNARSGTRWTDEIKNIRLDLDLHNNAGDPKAILERPSLFPAQYLHFTLYISLTRTTISL